MSSPSENPLKRLIREIHRRSLWQVLGIYLVAGWIAFEVVQTLTEGLGLPEWFPAFAIVLLVLGLPVVLATAFVQEGGPGSERAPSPAAKGSGSRAGVNSETPSRLFTWRNAFGGGVLAFALWGAVAAAWLVFAGGTIGTEDSTSVALAVVAEVEEAMDRGDWIEAYRLATALPPEVPDSTHRSLFSSVSVTTSLVTEPVGAMASWRPYDRPDMEWEILGTTPLEWDAPRSAVTVRFEHEGHVPRIVGIVPLISPVPATVPLRRQDEIHPDALYMQGGESALTFGDARIAHAPPVTLGEYLIDRYEVTNRLYKEFVDAGGYQRRQYWEHPFERDGAVLTWEEAMAEFVDRTGRPGPSTWVGGTFPEGMADHPVTGISWYEAAAYANFMGRALPTLYHWFQTAGLVAAQWVVPFSNYGSRDTAPVGSNPGVSPTGAFDMAGNAREWLANSAGSLRYTAGGGWNDPPYLFGLTQPQPPMDRSETNGVRLMTNLGDAASLALAARPVEPVSRDFTAESPVSDEVFDAFLDLYRYDERPLNVRVEAVDTVEVGIRERITLDAAYGRERMTLYLIRPLGRPGPHQAVVYFTGSGALNLTDSQVFLDRDPIVSFLVRSGRAVAFPVLKSTFERQDDYVYRLQDPSNAHRDHVIQWRQDIGRSLDYLQTRPDVDNGRFGYFGWSWGGRMGVIVLAVEPRFRAAVLLVGGLSPLPTQPVVDPFNFAPRVRLPVLMLSGEYDQIYPLETSARPLFELLGTDEEEKAHFIAEGGHLIPEVDGTRETLNWFDRYLGEVR